MVKLRKNHKFLSSAGYIKQICKPLQFFNIHLFTYLKKFKDGTEINLSTDPQWVSDYYDLSLYETSQYEAAPGTYETGFKLWPISTDTSVFHHGRTYFDSNYGLTYCLQQSDGCEFFFFSLSSDNYSMLEICLNNLDLLEKFIVYFKDKASELLKDCEQHKIIVPGCVSETPQFVMSDKSIRTQFIQAIKSSKDNPFASWLYNHEPLTKRETECLHLLLIKPTTIELAGALNISTRTAESHLDRIKSKLQCRTKQELLIKLARFSEDTDKYS